MVVESHPRLEDGSPFPTTFWLTCPVLIRRIGTLEADGWMNAFNERLASDGDVKQRLASAIARYRDRRDAHERIEESGSPPGGGPDRIKCVHAHAAQELAQPPNPVGSAALADAGYPDCVVPCFAVVE
jgi:hypothetical protein